MNQVTIGSDNGLSPIRRQAIIWTNAVLMSFVPLLTNFGEILINKKLFIHENVADNIVCEMAAILSRRGEELRDKVHSKWIKGWTRQIYIYINGQIAR